MLELWELAPTPAAARRIRTLTVEKLLKRHRIRRVDALGALAMLRRGEIKLPQAITDSRVVRIKTIVEHMKIADRHIKDTEASMDEMDEMIETMNEKLRTEGGEPTDIEILRSIPGVGRVTLSTLLGEDWA